MKQIKTVSLSESNFWGVSEIMVNLNEVYKSVLDADRAAVVICDLDHTIFNEKENKDVYMVALRNDAGELIAYYEKHEYRNRETMRMYDIGEYSFKFDF